MRLPSLHESMPFIAGVVLATSGCASQELSAPIVPSEENAVYIPANTEVFAGEIDRTEIDSTFVGNTAQEVSILHYELSEDSEVACVDKSTISRDMISEPQNWLYWKSIGKICFESKEILSSLESWQVYPERAD